MRLSLWCVCWTLTLHTAALQGGVQPGHRHRDGVQTRVRKQSTGGLDAGKPAAVRGSGEKLNGPHVCGGHCCVGWTLLPKTRRCTKPRCLPRCHNNAACRQTNRCVCRRGFHGYRCQFSTETFPAAGRSPTSVRPTSVPQTAPKPAQRRATRRMEVRTAAGSGPGSGPAAMEAPPASTRPATITKTSSEPGASDMNPPPAQAEGHNKDQDAKIPDPGPVPGDVSKESLLQEENRTSPKSRRAERTETPEFNDLQPGDTAGDITGFKTSNVQSDSEPEEAPRSQARERPTEGPNLESPSWSDTEGKASPGLNESPKTDSESEVVERLIAPKILNLESNSRPEVHQGPNPEFSPVEAVVRGEKKKKEVKKQTLSLREAQALLLRKSHGGSGDKMAALLMKHIEKERKKLTTVTSSSSSTSSSSVKTSVNTFHTQKGQYTVRVTAPTADGQAATGGGGRGVERIQVTFTPTICKVRCSQERCVNYCERGNLTTLYSGSEGGGERRQGSHGPGFRVFLCPLLCKNGGVCLQKDRCLCPPNFTGKFCQIPVAVAAETSPSSTNEIVKPALFSAMPANQELSQSEFLLPLGQNEETARSGDPGLSLVKVRVQHPPEASVKIHQVLKVKTNTQPVLRMLSSSSSSGSAGAPAPAGVDVQAQTLKGDGAFAQQSGFKYCFREVKDGQCSAPLPGLRSREMCCRGIGKAWGITDCVLCPDNTGQSNRSCPAGFEGANGTQCVDVNECLQPGLCENGICVNTRGSYSCVCRAGFILDATHAICISQSVISQEKGQCHRVLGPGRGPASCSLPILRNITKQICCCSRVGKAWGPDCQRCPYFGSVAFKEICPAGPGYHYSASTLLFNQRLTEQLGSRGAPLVVQGNQDNQGPSSGSSSSGASRSQQKPSSSGATEASTSLSSSSGVGSSAGSAGTNTRPSPPQPPPRQVDSPSSRPVQPGSTSSTATQDKPQTPGRPAPSFTTHARPQPPSTGSRAGGQSFSVSRTDQPEARGDSLPAPAQPQNPERGSRPSGGLPPLQSRPAVTPTLRPTRVQTRGVCESRPGVCGRGRCVDQPGGKHTCVCDQGYQPNSQRTYCQDVNECVQSPGVCSVGECVNTMGSYRCVCPSGYRSSSQLTGCQDIDECQQNPCSNGRCENTPGSYRCVCRLGYRLSGNTCTDVDECEDALQCPGQECINSQGSYRCVSCQAGYRLLNRVCTDVDECRQAPCSNGRCENTPGSYRCVCRFGYKLQNNTCTDVDECAEPSQCPGQMCVNTAGSYRCVSCRPGFTLANRQCADVNECEDSESCPGQRCVNTEGSYSCVDCQQGYHSVNGLCADVDECVQASQCPGQLCVNTAGSYRCVSCRPGFSSKDGSCQDIDECASAGACEAERVCVNTVGSFRCDCRPGYRTSALGRQCRDINECLEGDFCFPRGECVNSPGSYTCVCSQGFTLSDNRTACLDVDECVKSGVCLDGRCVNTEGSFQCQCQTGFTTNPERTACLDVDECVSTSGTVCGSKRCENTIGSYHCLTSCEPGYQVTQTGDCVDVNECANQTVCGVHASCQNLLGTYLCVCDQGFTSAADGKACVDEDECVSLPGVCGSARCENVEGSFMCECDRRGDEFDQASRRCVATPRAPDYASFSSSSSSSVHVSVVELAPVLPPLPEARPGELRECYYNLAERGTCSLLATNTSQQECCCTLGEGWGMGCLYHTCPPTDTDEFLSLCPSGRGYVTTGPGAFSYRDVDECKRFHPEVCKNGQCVNNIPGYSCYCPSGYIYNIPMLECVDVDECEEERCVGGVCVNTVGSYYCSCPPTLVLDDTQRNCVNSSHLTVDENLSICWQHVTADLMCQSPLVGPQFTFVDCCCLYGEGWGMQCALCPSNDSEDYGSLCSSFLPPFAESFPDSTGPEPGLRPGFGRGSPPYLPPYSPDSFPPAVVPSRDFSVPDYDDYSPAGGSRSGFRGRTPSTFSLPDGGFRRPEFSTGYYSEGDFGPPDGSQPRTPSIHFHPDPRAERAFGARPPPPSRAEGAPLSLAPLPGAPYQEQEEQEEEEPAWRPGPPFTERSRGGAPRRVYERRYESYAGLSAAEDCGILHGCENGRCIRVAEGYTCDCYQGYELDMTSMTCIDINECEDGVSVDFPCVNARCVNTDGSFRCVCRRGYVMSRRPNYCVAA
ncbi:latent-transforming growth factor beta-binding protein 2-like isoform X4 [Micropterus salmoides]|uniref:latent-transforming growth factor beta-binding protein 2-like isoform X4 n=1 Tax=Micropterus salmoides TaxID=27706 RepID=UPI0018EB0AF5|nr:latent-transforming growth factor beta-binding protein 2-like isoform X4 [Micropterus salmoides]